MVLVCLVLSCTRATESRTRHPPEETWGGPEEGTKKTIEINEPEPGDARLLQEEPLFRPFPLLHFYEVHQVIYLGFPFLARPSTYLSTLYGLSAFFSPALGFREDRNIRITRIPITRFTIALHPDIRPPHFKKDRSFIPFIRTLKHPRGNSHVSHPPNAADHDREICLVDSKNHRSNRSNASPPTRPKSPI